ncbi:MAG: ATP-binding protein [Arenicellaceae bacterium]|nr:ATP-binding protein [Arenicellaceae bacterium]
MLQKRIQKLITLGLLPKLVIIFVFFSFASVAALVLIVSSGDGLLNYVNQREQIQVLDIHDDLESFYAEQQSWNLFQGTNRAWQLFIETSVGNIRGRGLQQIIETARSTQNENGTNESAPNRNNASRNNNALRNREASNNELRFRPPAPRRRPQTNLGRRIRLLDEGGLLVAGPRNPAPNAQAFTLEYNGQSVGQLTVNRIALLQGEFELAFQAAQRRLTYITAIVLLMFSALMAWAVGRYFLSPINRLSKGTQELAGGKLGLQLKNHRKDELGELVGLFNKLSSSLEASKSARDRWVADIAHELRTPLGIMRGEIEALQDGTRKVNETALSSLLEEVAYLSRLVNDLYELSLSDAGGLKYQFRPCNLVEIVQSIVDSFRVTADREGLDVKFENLLVSTQLMSLDEDRIAQLVSNLLTNSVRYTDKPGKVVVSLSPASSLSSASAADAIQLMVSDSSPGVLEEHIPHLFDRLFRVEMSRNRTTGGAGIGLAICKNITEAHGGTISAAASKYGGLTVVVVLPINPIGNHP